MDKLIASVLIIALVVFLYLGIFQGQLSDSIQQKGIDVINVIDSTNSK